MNRMSSGATSPVSTAPTSPISAAPDLSSDVVSRNARSKRQLGFMKAKLSYEDEKGSICLRVYEVRELKSARSGLSDPYIKCYLLPDSSKKTKKKTTPMRNTCNPWWDEELRWRVDPETVHLVLLLPHLCRMSTAFCRSPSGTRPARKLSLEQLFRSVPLEILVSHAFPHSILTIVLRSSLLVLPS